MKLLIVTQKIDKNDPILGFFVRWVEEFAKHVETLTVICLEKGDYDLPKNVKVLSLGKEVVRTERGLSSRSPEGGERSVLGEYAHKIQYVLHFYKYIFQFRKNYDSVFVHMNPIYVVLGGFLWRAWGKKVGLWYTHKSVDLKLRIAEKITHHIFTASKESFRLPSNKLNILGHGIDVSRTQSMEYNLQKGDTIKMIHVGRITKSKNILAILETMRVLNEKNIPFKLTLVGSPITEDDKKYKEKLDDYVVKNNLGDKVYFIGNVLHSEVFDIYKENHIAINLSDTGSMDKSVLEAMISGLHILTSNEAFKDILPPENQTTKDAKQIAESIESMAYKKPNKDLMDYVQKEHDLESLIPKIIKFYK